MSLYMLPIQFIKHRMILHSNTCEGELLLCKHTNTICTSTLALPVFFRNAKALHRKTAQSRIRFFKQRHGNCFCFFYFRERKLPGVFLNCAEVFFV
uniref:Uncharacterized protein n=1 Tax=Anguilla anguilla TaxID=7936 RepID=A0A0E9WJM9_ANGAN